MENGEKLSGYVEEVYSYGKCGYIRELLGGRYYYNSKSFAPNVKRRMHVSDFVSFTPGERPDAKTGNIVPYAQNIVNITENLKNVIGNTNSDNSET